MEHKQEPVEVKDEVATEESVQRPVEDTPIATAHVVAPKKQRHWLWLVFGGVLLLAILAAITYLLIARPWQPKATPVAHETKQLDLGSAQSVVSEARKGLSGSILSAVRQDGAGGVAEDGTPVYVLPLQQVGGNSFASVPATGSGTGYAATKTIAATNHQALAKFFTDNKFNLKTTDTQKSPVFASTQVSSVNYAVYASSKVVCAVWQADATKIAADRHVSSVGCANVGEYQTVASKLAVLATAYKQSSNAKDAITIGMPTDYSGLEGYSGVSVPQADSVQFATDGAAVSTTAYYYKQGTGDWKYIATSKDATPACTVFNTDTLKQLFKDAKCS